MARCSKQEAMETRERLLDAALEVFHAEGVSRPSLSKVAELAGVTRGCVYGHFENKADLFNALCDRMLLPAETLSERPSDPDDPLGALREWSVGVLRDAVSDPSRRKLLEVIFHKCEILDAYGAIRQRRLRNRRQGSGHMRALVARAVARGQLPADLDVDAASVLLHSSVVGALSQWLFAPEEFDLPGHAERFADGLIDMIRLSPALRTPPNASAAP